MKTAAGIMLAAIALSQEARGAWETSGNINPRVEAMASASQQDWARRGLLKSQLLTRNQDFSFNFEGFFEYDVAQSSLEPNGAPDLRKSRGTGALQEIYFDARHGSIFFRAGRQPVRWSQSWTIPSLDVFTGRRWNRLFVDPVPEQLTHPDGVLVSYAGSLVEADVFHAVQPAENVFPVPLPDLPRLVRDQTGARVKVRFAGFDVAAVLHRRPEDTLIGGSVSYAFDAVVLKAEAGQRTTESGFGLVGFDYFGTLGNLEINFSPQATWYREPLVTGTRTESLYYAPLRLTYKRTAFEAQYYKAGEVRDTFGSLLLSRELSDYKGASLKAAVFHQTYLGEPGRLFSLFESLSATSIAGFRLDLNYTL